MNPLNFFPNPQQEALIRSDIYRQRPVINANTTGITNTQLDSNGNPLQLGNSAEFVPVQIVSKNGSIVDSNGYYHCRLLFPWMNTQQDDDIGIVTHVRLDALGASLTEKSMHLAQYWSVTLNSPDPEDDGYLLLKLVVPGNLPIVVLQINGKDGSTNPADNIIAPDLIAPIADDLCLWDAQILSLTSHGGTLSCGYLSYPGETEGPSKCLCFDIGYYDGMGLTSNPRLIRVGGNYFGTYVTDIQDPANPTSKRIPVFAIKSECGKGEVYKLIDNGNGTGSLLIYIDGFGYTIGSTVKTVELTHLDVQFGTGPESLQDVRYATYQEDTGLFEYLRPLEPFEAVLYRREEYAPGLYQYGWDYRNGGQGGILQAEITLTQTQFFDGLNPSIFKLEIIGATGATYLLYDNMVSSGPLPYMSDAATIEASLIHFTVTGAYPTYNLTGPVTLVDGAYPVLTYDDSDLEPFVSTNPARFTNPETPMCVPVNVWLKQTDDETEGTDSTFVFKVIWSNGTLCCGVFGGVDLTALPSFTPAPTSVILITPDTTSVGPWTLTQVDADTGTYQLIIDAGDPISTNAGLCPDIGSPFTVVKNDDNSCTITGDGENHLLQVFGGLLRANAPDNVPVIRNGCMVLKPIKRCPSDE